MSGVEDEEEFTSLGAAIRGARIRAGLTQKQAAEQLGLGTHWRTWQNWEHDEGGALAQLHNIEKVLELPRGYFVAQLSVLERLFVFEAALERIEAKLEENSEVLRDVLGLLRVKS